LINSKRVCRLYREMGLQLRNKSPKRRVKAQLRDDRTPATVPNQVWAMDFVHDQLFDGRKIRILTIVDTFTRLSPAIEVRQQFRGADVVETLERVSREIGYPKTIRLDNVLSGDARALFGQQVSFAGVDAGDQHRFTKWLPPAEGIALSHSKHRVHRVVALTVLKTRCAIQVEDPNIIYRVAAFTAPSRLYRARVLPLGTGPSWKGR